MKPKKDAKYLNVNIRTPVYDELEAFSNQTGVSKTAAVEQSLRMYMDDFYTRNEHVRLAVKEALDGKSEQ